MQRSEKENEAQETKNQQKEKGRNTKEIKTD
jgi:hypothetical protein